MTITKTLISIIVPVYKAEKTLIRCVEGIFAQSYTEWELLLVDDGSPDSSRQLCEELASHDSRVRVFHKLNGGVSSARNWGLDNAKGDYVSFLDSDDWVTPDYLEVLISQPKDLTFCNTTLYNEEGGEIGRRDAIPKGVYMGKEISNLLKGHLYINCFRVPWGKLFRTSIIKENGIRFDEKMKLGEDTLFVQNFLCHCDSIAIHNRYCYNYSKYVSVKSTKRPRYMLNSEEYAYSMQVLGGTYHDLTKLFSFTEEAYREFYTSFFTRTYLASLPYKPIKELLKLKQVHSLFPENMRKKHWMFWVIKYGILNVRYQVVDIDILSPILSSRR